MASCDDPPNKNNIIDIHTDRTTLRVIRSSLERCELVIRASPAGQRQMARPGQGRCIIGHGRGSRTDPASRQRAGASEPALVRFDDPYGV